MADTVRVIGLGSVSATTVTFARPYIPYPNPTLKWADRIVSEHQMRPGESGGNLVGGDIVYQDFGVPANGGFIEISVPFITSAMKTGLWTIYLAGGTCNVHLTDDNTTYECLMQAPKITPRTSRCSEIHDSPYSVELSFRVLGEA